MSRKMIAVGPMNQFEKQLLESSIDPMTGRNLMQEEKLTKGMRVKISDGSGTLSGKMGVVIDPSAVKTDGRGSPTNVQGAYKPVDWSKEVAIKLDNGEITTMYKNRVSPMTGECGGIDVDESKKSKYYDSKNNVQDYIDFLEGTLIPDLKDSGTVETAKDFETMIKFLRGAKGSVDGYTKEAFINFLHRALIPDLKDSGTVETAKDFETGIKHLKKMGTVKESDGQTQDLSDQYEIMDMGYDSPSYFRWQGALYSPFDDAIYDVGMTPREAVDQLKDRLWDIPGLSKEVAQAIADELDADIAKAGKEADKTFYDVEGEPNPDDDGGENMLYHIGVKYKLDGGKKKIGEASPAFRAKAKKGEVMWSEELAYALKQTAKDIAQRFSKELEQDAAQLAQDMEMNVTDKVRTVSNGVKTLDLALKLFVADELSTDVLGGNPELGILGESIGEAKTPEEKLGQALPGTNLYFRSFARDVNGNTVIRLKSKDGRGFSIQTNGNLPKSHALRGEKQLNDAQLKDVAGEVADYVGKYHKGMPLGSTSKVSESSEKFVIADWAGNVKFHGQKFDSAEDAEEFLSTELGDDYESERGEYEIKTDGKVSDSRHIDPKDPRAGKKIGESDDDSYAKDAAKYAWFILDMDKNKIDSGWISRSDAADALRELRDEGRKGKIVSRSQLDQNMKDQVKAWTKESKDCGKKISESKDSELYIVADSSKPQQGEGDGRSFGVIYQGQSMMATTTDHSKAVKVAQKIADDTKKTVSYHDGDTGEVVGSVEELLRPKTEAKSAAKTEKKTYKKAFSNNDAIKESKDPSAEQLKAMSDFAAKNGKEWKSKLAQAWMTGRGVTPELQQIRNQFGPSWLNKFILPQVKEESDGGWNLDAVQNPDELDDVIRGEAPTEIKAYAKKKQEAMKLRLAGKVNDAMKVERELDKMYDRLPEDMKTW